MHVGYLGVGNMGQPMAGKLLDGGHGLTIYDIDEAAMEPLLLRRRGAPHRRRSWRINARSSSYRCPPSLHFAPRY